MEMICKNFLTDETVFFAESRARRPHNFKKINVRKTPREYCPFCLENEHLTPKKVYGTQDNRIRIIPNKYPFLTPTEDYFAVHDVIVDTADHDELIHKFSYENFFRLMKVLRMRVDELEKDERIKHVQVFKNQGVDAGASQSHSHWQITGMPVVSEKYKKMFNKLKNYEAENGKCYFCSLEFGKRIIEENANFTAFCPEDARFSYEINILPKRHIGNFKYFTDEELYDFGKILKHCLMKLNSIYDGLSYNICFYHSSCDGSPNNMHFFAQIISRIGSMAGFEFSTGCYINSTYPEKAAETLRNIKTDEEKEDEKNG